jgi:Tol biopolymer transport system component
MVELRKASFAAAVALSLGACSSNGDDASSPTTSEPPTTTATTTATEGAAAVGDGEEWIAFQGGPQGISLIRPDGTGGHVILGPPGDQNHPDWSPDGSEIAYVQYDETYSTVMITDVEGERPRLAVESFPPDLEDLFWENPAWSRDGAEIAMVGYEGDPNQTAPTRSVLVVVDVATGGLTLAGELTLAEGRLHSFPRWSPDGQAMVLNVDYFTAEAYDGSTVAIIRRGADSWSAPEEITEVGQFGRVDWHPTDDLIVFCDYDIGGFQSTDEPTNLYTVKPDGSQRLQLTSFGAGEERASQPTWTSDGRILFTYVTGDDDLVREIALLNADGSGLEVVVAAGEIGPGNRPHPRMRPV